jgi:hypothetical protein
MTSTTINQFQTAKTANAPLIAINTPDPASTIKSIRTVYSAGPVVQWDVINGIQSLGPLTIATCNQMNTMMDGSVNPAMATGNPVEALMKVAGVAKANPAMINDWIMFFIYGHLFMDKATPGNLAAPVVQAVWNIRDVFKRSKANLVILAPQFTVPDELQHDVVVIDEPLPSETELTTMINRSFSQAGLKKPTKRILPGLLDATSGLAPFAVDQIIKMSVTKTKRGKTNIDTDELWRRKITRIENTAGLKIHRFGPRFSDIGGNENIKDLLSRIAKSDRRPRLVVFIDEIEKALHAAGTDTSGTTTDQLKVLLTEMQNNDWTGLISYGFPGTGKSELSKAFGNEAGAITVEADLGAMKHIWVGSSEARMRSFVKIIKAMGGSRVFFMATCNHIDILRPELKRRFKKGIFFSDLPCKKERDVIWNLYLKKFSMPQQEMPIDEGWTGAEIRVCCETANELKIPLKEACRFMTIVSHAMGTESVEKMRREASGKYVSTQHPGVYKYEKEQK